MPSNQLIQGGKSQDPNGLIYVIEDDADLRCLLHCRLEMSGYRVKSFSCPLDFLRNFYDGIGTCMITDYLMPSMSGLELVSQLSMRGCQLPFIVLTGHATISSTVEFMKMGAISVLEKPCSHTQLLHCVELALARSSQERLVAKQRALLMQRLPRLTPKELVVLRRIDKGRLSKQIGVDLNISCKTVEVHRSHIIKKMEVQSMMQLIQMLANSQIDIHVEIYPEVGNS